MFGRRRTPRWAVLGRRGLVGNARSGGRPRTVARRDPLALVLTVSSHPSPPACLLAPPFPPSMLGFGAAVLGEGALRGGRAAPFG